MCTKGISKGQVLGLESRSDSFGGRKGFSVGEESSRLLIYQ